MVNNIPKIKILAPVDSFLVKNKVMFIILRIPYNKIILYFHFLFWVIKHVFKKLVTEKKILHYFFFHGSKSLVF